MDRRPAAPAAPAPGWLLLPLLLIGLWGAGPLVAAEPAGARGPVRVVVAEGGWRVGPGEVCAGAGSLDAGCAFVTRGPGLAPVPAILAAVRDAGAPPQAPIRLLADDAIPWAEVAGTAGQLRDAAPERAVWIEARPR